MECKALVLSGGGANGAWEAGVLYGLAHNDLLDPSAIRYDVVAGVSAGAINASALALYPPGEEKKATEWNLQTWENLTSDDIYETYIGGQLAFLW